MMGLGQSTGTPVLCFAFERVRFVLWRQFRDCDFGVEVRGTCRKYRKSDEGWDIGGLLGLFLLGCGKWQKGRENQDFSTSKSRENLESGLVLICKIGWIG